MTTAGKKTSLQELQEQAAALMAHVSNGGGGVSSSSSTNNAPVVTSLTFEQQMALMDRQAELCQMQLDLEHAKHNK